MISITWKILSKKSPTWKRTDHELKKILHPGNHLPAQKAAVAKTILRTAVKRSG
jgi:hypothetical protein